MKFGLRLIIAGLAGLGAGALFISMSFEKPVEGMAPTPIWKGVVALLLGVGLIGFGLKYMVDENREKQASPDESA